MNAIERYTGKGVGELRGLLVARDRKIERLNDDAVDMDEMGRVHRVVRLSTTAIGSVLVGMLYGKYAGLQSFGGTSFGMDHVLAIVGTGASMFMAFDDSELSIGPGPDIAEGVANIGLVPLLKKAGERIAA